MPNAKAIFPSTRIARGFFLIKTARQTGGLFLPYKGAITDMRLKALLSLCSSYHRCHFCSPLRGVCITCYP